MAKKPKRQRKTTLFTENFKKVLQDRGINLRTASDLLELPSSTVADWINGSAPNDVEAIGRFCRKLGLDFEWLLLGTKSNADPSDIPIEDIFEEQDAGFEGVYKIKAVRLVRKIRKTKE